MKKEMIIENKEQVELICDPFCLSILSIMEDRYFSAKEVAKNLDEDYEIIKNYMEKLYKNKLLVKNEQNEYQRVAEDFELKNLSNNFDGDVFNHWIFGLTHHIEGNFTDLLKIMVGVEDTEEYLNKLGYENNMFKCGKIYLTREEAREFEDYLNKFFKEHRRKSDEGDEEKRPYEVNVIMNPELSYFKNLINEKEEK